MFKQEITKFFPNIATYIFFLLHVGFLFYEAWFPVYVYVLINFYKVTKI